MQIEYIRQGKLLANGVNSIDIRVVGEGKERHIFGPLSTRKLAEFFKRKYNIKYDLI